MNKLRTINYIPSQKTLTWLNKQPSYGYIARITDGKLVRVARVTPSGVDYNYEQN